VTVEGASNPATIRSVVSCRSRSGEERYQFLFGLEIEFFDGGRALAETLVTLLISRNAMLTS